jgi:hypothetical protein
MSRRVVAEALGTAVLLASIVGSGIRGERLAGGNGATAAVATLRCFDGHETAVHSAEEDRHDQTPRVVPLHR